MMRCILSLILLCPCLSAFSLDVTLYINKDSTEVNLNWVSACSFNTSDTFNMKNAIIPLLENEVLDLTIINRDTLEHTFTIDGEVSNIIAALSTSQLTVSFSEAGTYRYYSDKPYGAMIGASGMIFVGYQNMPRFYWNLFELEPELSHELARTDIDHVPNDFQPESFFINGAYFPNTIQDPDAYVEVQLGDTVIISILNSGNMEHVLHFHGFHAKILHSSDASRIGWVKDTFPLDLHSTLTLRLVVDLEGTYPVHDHNLIAVTNTGFYPGGMITHIVVSP